MNYMGNCATFRWPLFLVVCPRCELRAAARTRRASAACGDLIQLIGTQHTATCRRVCVRNAYLSRVCRRRRCGAPRATSGDGDSARVSNVNLFVCVRVSRESTTTTTRREDCIILFASGLSFNINEHRTPHTTHAQHNKFYSV